MARLGLLLASVHGYVAPVWPAAGVAVAVLHLRGLHLWPLILLGSWAAHAVSDVTGLVAPAIAAGNTLEAVAGAWLWRVVADRWRSYPGLRDVAAGTIAAAVAPLLSASIGVSALVTLSSTPVEAGKLWSLWWAGHAVGVLTIAPALIAARQLVQTWRAPRASELGRAAVVLAATVAVSWLAFGGAGGGLFAFAIFPVLLLATAWLDTTGVRWMALLFSAGGLAATYAGHGPFADGSFEQNIRNVQVFLAAVAIAALALPAFRGDTKRLLPIVVLLGGWILSGRMYQLLERDAMRRQEEYFNERIAEAQAAIRVRMTTYTDTLRGGVSFVTASSEVTRDDWRVYAESLEMDARYPGMNGLGLIFIVPPGETEKWTRRMHADGAADYVIRPFPGTTAGPADPNYIITFIEPASRNTGVRGRNIATEASRRAAAETARDTGAPSLHHRAPFSRDLQRRSGLLLYYPLYKKDAPVATVFERRAAIIGWVYAQIFPDVFLDGALGPLASMLQLHFFEAGPLNRERLLYTSAGSLGDPLPEFERMTTVEIGGQPFQLGWRRGPKFPPIEKSPAVWAASSFAIATLLLAGLVTSLQSIGRRASAIAAERTAELAASEERFRQAFEFAGIGMALVALDGRFRRVNRAMCEITGYTEAALLQKTFRDITHPDDLGADLALVGELVAGQRSAYQMEKRYFHRDGRVVWVRLTTSLVRDARGAPVHFVAQVEDITSAKTTAAALQKSKEMFQRLFEGSPDAILLVNDRGQIVRTNARAARLFGWTQPALQGQPIDALIRGRLRAQPAELAGRFANPSSGSMIGGLELLGRRKGGVEFPIDLMLSPVETDDGMQTLAVARDITERKALEEKLAEARDEALRASRLKSEFLASMSHELRTPMNAIIGMAEALGETPLQTEQAHMLRVLRGGAENLLTIVGDILDISKIEAGKLRLVRAEFDPRRVLTETIALFAPRARQKGLALREEISGAPQAHLLGDAGRIQQVLSNLIGNAIKFTERGEIAVTAAVVSETPAAIKWSVAVSDTGCGIPRELLPQLFRPFVQAEESALRSRGGTGLGLAISRQLIELMGGEIGCESEPGRGSTFRFTMELPRATAALLDGAATLAPVATVNAREPQAEAGPAKPLRLLLAEDNAANQAVAVMLLRKTGAQLDVASDGLEALEFLGRGSYDAVLMDCQMPEMDGFQATVAIRRREGGARRLPIIAMTASALIEDRERCLAAGMDDYLPKPVKRVQLTRVLDRWVGADTETSVRPSRLRQV